MQLESNKIKQAYRKQAEAEGKKNNKDYRLSHMIIRSLASKGSRYNARQQAKLKETKNKIKAASAEIRKQAQQTLKEVKDLTGLMNVRF